MIKNSVLLLIITFFCSCNYENKNALTSKDSVAIFISVLNNKYFLKENLQYSDTLYIIKNKYYHQNYPYGSLYFKLFYIGDSIENKTENFPNKQRDNREKYEITNLSKLKDTAYLSLFNHGYGEGFSFKLIWENDKWVIVWKEHLMN